MTTITLKGQAIHTNGELPAVGTTAAKFAVTDTSLKEISSQDFAGKTLVLNIFLIFFTIWMRKIHKNIRENR